MDEQVLESLAQQLQDGVCPAAPWLSNADLVAWLKEELPRIQALDLPAELATQMIDDLYMNWMQQEAERMQ